MTPTNPTINLMNVAVGDRVGISHGGYHRGKWTVETVERVTKTQIMAGGMFFAKKNGAQVGGHAGAQSRLLPPEQAEANARRAAEQRLLNTAMQNAAELVARVVRDHRNWFGDYSPLTADQKAELLAAIQGLPTKE